MKIQVLMIDDNLKTCRLVKEYLRQREFEVAIAHTAVQGLEKAIGGDCQIIILEARLSGRSDFEILKRIRAVSTIPVLVLSNLGDEASRIAGLEAGADDYLSKPVALRELLARLRAVVRRSNLPAPRSHKKSEAITVGSLSLNAAMRKATKNGQTLILTSLEFDLLWCLARSAGRVLDRDKLLDEVAGRNYDLTDRSVDVHISKLRRKIGDDPKNPRYIRTIRSVGYILVSDANVKPDEFKVKRGTKPLIGKARAGSSISVSC